MKKYVTFGSTVLLRAAIVGFRQYDPRVWSCQVILESGAYTTIQGVTILEAITALEQIDAANALELFNMPTLGPG